jgi:SulP family sulfate permease
MRKYFHAGDLWGGLAAMLVALPQSIAFGITVFSAVDPSLLAQGAMAGILGAIAMGTVAPAFGGTPRLISSPCAPAAAFLAGLTAEAWMQGQPQSVVGLLLLVIVSAGAFQILFSVLGGGKVIKYIPYPVVAGYMSSVGIIIVAGQLPRLFGAMDPRELSLTPAHVHSVLIAAASVAAMIVGPRLTKAVPAPIFGLLAGLAVYAVLAGIEPAYRALENNPLVIGQLQGELSLDASIARFRSYAAMPLASLQESLIAGATLAVILSIDTLKSCVVVDTVTRSRSDSNRELLGQGLGNFTAALAGGIAGAGTLGATLVNVSSGGTTRMSGALAGVFSLVTLLFLSPLLAWVPIPALSGILILVGARMIDWKIVLLVLRKTTVLDFLVIVTVIVVALKFSLMAAAGAGVALSALFFLREQMRGSLVHKKSFGSEMSSKRSRLPNEQKVIRESGKRVVLYELQGSLFFGNTDRLFTMISEDLRESQFVILNMRRVQSMDSTALHMLGQISALLSDRNGRLFLTDLPDELSPGQSTDSFLREAGLLTHDSNVAVFEEFHYALEWTEDFLLKEKHLYHSHTEKALSLQEIELFHSLSPVQIEEVEPFLDKLSVAAGDVIFRSGDTTDSVFFIRQGIVKIMLPLNSHRAHHLASFGRGDFFGDMAFVDHEQRSADAVAETDCELYSLSRSRFDQLLSQDPAIGAQFYENLVRVLAHRFRTVHTELRALE